MPRLFRGSLLSRLLIVDAIVFAVVLAASLLTLRWYASSLRERIQDERVRATVALAGEVERTLHEAIALLRTVRTEDVDDASIEAELDRIAGQSTVVTGGVLLVDAGGTVRLADGNSFAFLGAHVEPPDLFVTTSNSKAATDAWAMAVPGRGNLIALGVSTGGYRSGPALVVGLIDPVDSGISVALNHARQIGQTGHADLIDRAGRTIASSERAHLLEEDHPTFYVAQARAATRVATIAQVPEEDGPDSGAEHVMGYAPLSVFGWGVALGGDVSATYAPLRQLWFAAAALAGGFTVLALAATYVGSLHLVRPVRQLSDAAKRVAAGDVDAPIATDAGGEIGQLGESVDSMRRELGGWGRELERRVADRTAELEVRSRELAVSASVARAASSTLEFPSLLRRTVEELKEGLGVDGVLAWLGGDGRRPPLSYASPASLAPASASALPCRMCADPPPEPMWCTLPPDERCFAAGFRAALSVPLRALDQPAGILCLLSRTPVSNSLRELEIAASIPLLAAEVGMGVGNAILYDDVRWREAHRQQLLGLILGAQEEERSRLARELHDDTGQALIAIMLSLDGLARAPRATGTDEQDLQRQLGTLRATSDEALGNLRRIILALRPSALDDIGLIAAIRRYATATLPPAGIEVVVQSAEDDLKLTPESETLVFRIVQESLNNIVRHSRAKHASVEVVEDEGVLIVRTQDDGIGLDRGAAPGPQGTLSGVGIEGMRERAALLGATLSLAGVPGKGTTVELRIPRGLELGEPRGP